MLHLYFKYEVIGMSVEKEKFRLGKYKFLFGSGVGRGASENFGKYAF